MGKATDTFGKLKFWLSVNLLFYAKTYGASRESNIESLILVSDFMVNSTMKIICMECMKCHKRMRWRRKNDRSCTDNQIATSAKSLDIIMSLMDSMVI